MVFLLLFGYPLTDRAVVFRQFAQNVLKRSDHFYVVWDCEAWNHSEHIATTIIEVGGNTKNFPAHHFIVVRALRSTTLHILFLLLTT